MQLAYTNFSDSIVKHEGRIGITHNMAPVSYFYRWMDFSTLVSYIVCCVSYIFEYFSISNVWQQIIKCYYCFYDEDRSLIKAM